MGPWDPEGGHDRTRHTGMFFMDYLLQDREKGEVLRHPGVFLQCPQLKVYSELTGTIFSTDLISAVLKKPGQHVEEQDHCCPVIAPYHRG